MIMTGVGIEPLPQCKHWITRSTHYPLATAPGFFFFYLVHFTFFQEERRSILEALTSRMCLYDDVQLDNIADMCEYFMGANFKALLYNAQLQVIQ